MNIPKTRGKSSLAYVTNEERKLLRRRDAVKGSPNAKTSPQGIPNLKGGDYRDDMAREKIEREKIAALKEAGFKSTRTTGGGGGSEEWVHAGKGLIGSTTGTPAVPYTHGPDARYAIPPAISVKDWKKDVTPPTKAPTTPEPIKVASSTPSSSGSAPVSAPSPPPAPPPTPTTATSAPAADPSPDGGITATIDASQLQQPMLDEIVANGVNSELLETRLTNLINKNNPLFKAATTKAMQAMAARGLVNSSIAEEAVMNAILSVAIPIAERDASAYMNQRMQNQAYSNEFRAQQNQAYYAQFLQKLQHSMDTAMRQLTERSANWRAVLAQRGSIATTSGMDTAATEAAMGAVTPAWWA